MPGSLSHLTRRFFDVLWARPLTESEKTAVGGWLTAGERSAFFAQSPGDQRHGYAAALTVIASGTDDRDGRSERGCSTTSASATPDSG